jgi:NADPH-dependent 2,4-dienoyl-CoA reductase/sulfur reductase-like enzyme
VLLKTSVLELNPKDSAVILDNGHALGYSSLVIATGGTPRHLTCPGAHLDGVIYLRTPEDGKAIAENTPGKKVVVIGSSFIGMELASLIVKKAASVTCVDMLECPFRLALGAEVGKAFLKMFEANGVHFKLGAAVKELTGEESGKVTGVLLADGTVLEADFVIAGIGVVPATKFLEGSGLDLDPRGYVTTDRFMKTKLPNVWAAGDIVVFPLSTFGEQMANIQHWQMALKQGQIAAKSIAGKPEPIHSVPFFWTVLFGKSFRYTGYGYGYDEVITHGNMDELKFVVYYLKEGKVVAVGSMNRDPVTAQIAEVFHHGRTITREDVHSHTTDDWSGRVF